jgi:cell division protein FtsB
VGKLTRILLPALLGLAVYYALFGGEYSVFEVRSTEARIEEEAAELARLRHEIDSLRARADSLETDSAALERIARERFGMIRDGEVLYRFAEPPDTAQEEDSVESGAR